MNAAELAVLGQIKNREIFIYITVLCAYECSLEYMLELFN